MHITKKRGGEVMKSSLRAFLAFFAEVFNGLAFIKKYNDLCRVYRYVDEARLQYVCGIEYDRFSLEHRKIIDPRDLFATRACVPPKDVLVFVLREDRKREALLEDFKRVWTTVNPLQLGQLPSLLYNCDIFERCVAWIPVCTGRGMEAGIVFARAVYGESGKIKNLRFVDGQCLDIVGAGEVFVLPL